MHPALIAQLLVLLAVANGTPIILSKVFGKALTLPVDGGAAFERPPFGAAKTMRGLVLSILVS
jgi:hypothetical protein